MSESPQQNDNASSQDAPAPEANEKSVSRRSFVTKGATLAAGAITGASVVGMSDTAKAAGAQDGNCRSMEVTFHIQGFGDMNPNEIMGNFERAGELLQDAIKRCPDEGGWGDWPRDASGDTEIRSVGFRNLPFNP
jgi:hypothetical protein